MSDTFKHAFGTRVVHGGQRPDPLTGAVMPPIYATSTYVQSSPGVHKATSTHARQIRRGTRLQAALTNLEGGHAGFAFASGMAATATVLELLDAGSHIVAMHDFTEAVIAFWRMCASAPPALKSLSPILPSCHAHSSAARNTRMLWVETPTNPLLKIVDLRPLRASRSSTACSAYATTLCHAFYSAAARARLRHRRAFDHKISEWPLGCGRRRGRCARR